MRFVSSAKTLKDSQTRPNHILTDIRRFAWTFNHLPVPVQFQSMFCQLWYLCQNLSIHNHFIHISDNWGKYCRSYACNWPFYLAFWFKFTCRLLPFTLYM